MDKTSKDSTRVSGYGRGERPPLEVRRDTALRAVMATPPQATEAVVPKYFRLRRDLVEWLKETAAEKGMSEVAFIEALLDAARRVQNEVEGETALTVA